MSVLETLIAAREKIKTPEKWTQGAYARVASGDSTAYRDPAATAYCAFGAICAAAPSAWDEGGCVLALRATRARDSLVRWNDAPGRTHAEVLALFDKAIQEQRDAAAASSSASASSEGAEVEGV